MNEPCSGCGEVYETGDAIGLSIVGEAERGFHSTACFVAWVRSRFELTTDQRRVTVA